MSIDITHSPIEFWKTKENPITCYKSKPNKGFEKKLKTKIKFIRKQPVMIINELGIEEKFETAVEASKYIGINAPRLYAILSGRLKNNTGYIINKIQL
jgi:hypothetical protein